MPSPQSRPTDPTSVLLGLLPESDQDLQEALRLVRPQHLWDLLLESFSLADLEQNDRLLNQAELHDLGPPEEAQSQFCRLQLPRKPLLALQQFQKYNPELSLLKLAQKRDNLSDEENFQYAVGVLRLLGSYD